MTRKQRPCENSSLEIEFVSWTMQQEHGHDKVVFEREIVPRSYEIQTEHGAILRRNRGDIRPQVTVQEASRYRMNKLTKVLWITLTLIWQRKLLLHLGRVADQNALLDLLKVNWDLLSEEKKKKKKMFIVKILWCFCCDVVMEMLLLA